MSRQQRRMSDGERVASAVSQSINSMFPDMQSLTGLITTADLRLCKRLISHS